jgi:hypothetical protein
MWVMAHHHVAGPYLHSGRDLHFALLMTMSTLCACVQRAQDASAFCVTHYYSKQEPNTNPSITKSVNYTNDQFRSVLEVRIVQYGSHYPFLSTKSLPTPSSKCCSMHFNDITVRLCQVRLGVTISYVHMMVRWESLLLNKGCVHWELASQTKAKLTTLLQISL